MFDRFAMPSRRSCASAWNRPSRRCTRVAPEALDTIRRLQAEAKAEGLWALGHPKELGGGGLPFMDYVYVNEIQGRSEYGQIALGTHSLQDSLMLNQYASHEWRERYLDRSSQAEVSPSFAMTEPEVASLRPDPAADRRRCSTATSG